MFLFLPYFCLILVQVLAKPSTSSSIIQPENYIVNGETAEKIVPYHAHLIIDSQINRVGSGVVIHDHIIITVAQNIQNFNSWRAGLGSLNRNNLIWRTTSLSQIHPDYNPVTLRHNIGLLLFFPSLTLIPNVVPIQLPPIISELNYPLVNEEGFLSGFGHIQVEPPVFPNNLQVSYKRVSSEQDCRKIYEIVDNKFCAIDIINNASICGGDQGGAFVTRLRGVKILTGIVSQLLPRDGCHSGLPALFIRVQDYRLWLNSRLNFS